MIAKILIAVFLVLAIGFTQGKGLIKNVVTKPPAKVPLKPAPEDLAVSCTFSGDPHVKSSFNSFYDFYAKGDYLLASYSGVKVFGRFNHIAPYPGRSVTTAVAVHVGNMRASIYAFDRQLKLNGQAVGKVDIGKKFENKKKTLSVTRLGENQYVIHGGLVRVVVNIHGNKNPTDANRYLDVQIFSSRKAVESAEYKGLCSKAKEQILGHFDKPMRQITPGKVRKHSRANGEKFCAKLRNEKAKFHACVEDYVIGGAKLAKSTLDLDKNKKNIRAFYAQKPACREAERQLAQLTSKAAKLPKNHPQLAALQRDIARFTKVIIPKKCKGKRKSANCKKAQAAYSNLARVYNGLDKSVNPAQRNNIYVILQNLGAKSRRICDTKRAIAACRKHRKVTIGTLTANLRSIEQQIAKVKAQIKTTKSKKCKVNLGDLNKFKNIRWN